MDISFGKLFLIPVNPNVAGHTNDCKAKFNRSKSGAGELCRTLRRGGALAAIGADGRALAARSRASRAGRATARARSRSVGTRQASRAANEFGTGASQCQIQVRLAGKLRVQSTNQYELDLLTSLSLKRENDARSRFAKHNALVCSFSLTRR